jgi:signal transduction histidine kinase
VRSLRTRLLVSHAAVVAVGALAMVVVAAVVTREVYGHRLGQLGFGPGRGRGSANAGQLRDELDRALAIALVAGVVTALVVGGVAAWLVSRRIVRPIDDIRDAATRMAAGDFDVQVPAPHDIELAGVAADISALGAHLAGTERRRLHLMAEVTHELRTPVTVIRGHVEALLDGDAEPDPEVFAAVADEASRIERLVDDLSLLSRSEEGRLDLRHEWLDLGALAATAADRLRPQFDFAEVALHVAAPPSVLGVVGDRDRLLQVLTNVLGNALGHTPPGGTVRVSASVAGDRATVVVTDDGAGIAADDVDRIFDRFYRAPTGDGPTRASRGLGLTIANSLAVAHGGDLSASSPGPGRGATFTLVLPLAPMTSAQ